MPRVRAVLIDLDGVVRLWRPDDAAIERAHGLPQGAIRTAAFASGLLHLAITGVLTDSQWRDRIVSDLSTSFPGLMCRDAVHEWTQQRGLVNHEVVALLRSVRRSCAVVLVTNATSRLHEDLTELGLVSEFDHVVNSSRVGYAKPREQIFRAALGVVECEPEEAVFVDDTSANVDAALHIGIAAHRYTSAKSLQAFLRSTGVAPRDA